jgi:VanZ family protein
MRKVIYRYVPVIVWCGFIFFLSSQSRLPGPEDKTFDFVLKKLGHVTVYAVLFRLVYMATNPKTSHRALKTFVFCILYALSDEYHQSFVPGRTPMLTDIGIDTLGMVISWKALKLRL